MFGDTDDTPMLPPDDDDDGDDQPPVPDKPTSTPPTEPPTTAPTPDPAPHLPCELRNLQMILLLHSLVLAITKQGGKGHT